jgi:hypothetical protein
MKWVSIHKTNAVTEAETLKSMLESFGIPARVAAESIRTPFGPATEGMGVAVLSVPEDRAEEARGILAKQFPTKA